MPGDQRRKRGRNDNNQNDNQPAKKTLEVKMNNANTANEDLIKQFEESFEQTWTEYERKYRSKIVSPRKKILSDANTTQNTDANNSVKVMERELKAAKTEQASANKRLKKAKTDVACANQSHEDAKNKADSDLTKKRNEFKRKIEEARQGIEKIKNSGEWIIAFLNNSLPDEDISDDTSTPQPTTSSN